MMLHMKADGDDEVDDDGDDNDDVCIYNKCRVRYFLKIVLTQNIIQAISTQISILLLFWMMMI